MNNCNKLVNNGMILRYISTIITFYFLFIHMNNIFIFNNLYIILFIALILLDEVDNIFTKFYKYNGIYNGCTHLFHYQITDKICDSISYLLLYLFFVLDNVLLFFILYRIIGVILFYFSKNSQWLILFFDFAKEYLLYLFFFGEKYLYIPIFVLLKIIFEYYYHTMHNINNYKY